MEFFDEFDIDNRIIESYEVKVKTLKVNDFIIIELQPCKITSLKIKQTNKAGCPKLYISAKGLLNEKLYNSVLEYNDSVISTPVINKREYFLSSLDRDNFVSLMDLKGNTRSDVKLNYETENDKKISEKLKLIDYKKKEVLVSVLSVLGYDKIVDYKLI